MRLPSDFKIGDPNPLGHSYPEHWTEKDIKQHLKAHNKIRNQRFYENSKIGYGIHHKKIDRKIKINCGIFLITFD
jgi:hypothetical protein